MPANDPTSARKPAIIAPMMRYLEVSDIGSSLAFYRDVLGFDVREMQNENAVVEVWHGPARIQFGAHTGRLPTSAASAARIGHPVLRNRRRGRDAGRCPPPGRRHNRVVRLLLILRTDRHKGIGSAYVYVEDADALHAELLAKGAKVQGEPVSQPWGLRDFRVLDLEGNEITFGQPFE